MTGFLAFLVFFGGLSAFIMPWVNSSRVSSIKQQMEKLTQIIKHLVAALEKAKIKVPNISELEEQDDGQEEPDEENVKEAPIKIAPKKCELKNKFKVGFERQFGARLPVWLGGVALALAGFFLIKYSIEHNLISPTIRLIFGCVFGFILLGTSHLIQKRPNFANGARISQSLAGAGIAILYLVSYASARVYGLVPDLVGFLEMAIVTIIAFTLSVRHGAPIALIGMAGGFLTPALLGTATKNAFSLFVYLYFVVSGLLLVIRKTKLWWLAIPAVAVSFIWILIWLIFSFSPGDGIWLGLFLFGICVTILISSKDPDKKDKAEVGCRSITNYLALGGALILMGIITNKSNFGLMEWGLFWLLSTCGIGLAYFDQKRYGFVPWLSGITSVIMLSSWGTQNYAIFASTLLCFAVVNTLGAYFCMWKTKKPVFWACLVCSSSLLYYLLAYYKLHTRVDALQTIPLFWSSIAIALSIPAIYTVKLIGKFYNKHEHKEYLLAIFAILSTSFISIAMAMELSFAFLSIALSLEMLAIAWINTTVSIKALRYIIGALGAVFGVLLAPQILIMLSIILDSLIPISSSSFTLTIPKVKDSLLYFALPALMFVGSAVLLRKEKDSSINRTLEGGALILFAVMGYYITLSALSPGQNSLHPKLGLFERGIITNLTYMYGFLCLLMGEKFKRSVLTRGGSILFKIAMAWIIYFDLLLYNWIWGSATHIKGVVGFNSLLLPFGLPIIWHYMVAKKELLKLTKTTGVFMLIALFMLVTSNVRYAFHEEELSRAITTNAEIYTYSVVWLLLGMGLLFGGIVTKDKMLRLSSLGVMLFTTSKVFIYDASALEGLYRIFSFFGLGVSLIGLGYLYMKFVFKEEIK